MLDLYLVFDPIVDVGKKCEDSAHYIFAFGNAQQVGLELEVLSSATVR